MTPPSHKSVAVSNENYFFSLLPPNNAETATTATAPTATPAIDDRRTKLRCASSKVFDFSPLVVVVVVDSCFFFRFFFRFFRVFFSSLLKDAVVLVSLSSLLLSSDSPRADGVSLSFPLPPTPFLSWAFPPHTSLSILPSRSMDCPFIVAVICVIFDLASWAFRRYIF